MSNNVIFKNDQANKQRSLTDAIKANLEVNNTIIKEKVPHQVYDANLPEGLTPDLVKSLSTYNGNYATAGRVAIAETAADVFLAHKDVNKVEGSIGYFAHGDSMNVTVDRSKEYRAGIPKEGEEVAMMTKHLVITDSFDVKSSSYKTLKDAISAEFRDSFAK